MPRKKLAAKNINWSPELSYAIGLLTTDGCLSTDGRHIEFRSAERSQTDTFKRCLGVNAGIRLNRNNGFSNKPTFRVQFSDAALYRWLLKIGLSPHKTYSIGALKIPDKYFRDFLRGHLDGDGSVTTYLDRYNTLKNPKYIYQRLFVRFISASKKHVLWIRQTIGRLANVKGDLNELKPKRDYQRTSIWQLKFMKKASLKLIPWLYYRKNLPCLKRKREYAEKAMVLF